MRRIQLSTPLQAPADRAWQVLLDTDGWSRWGRFATSAHGDLVPGSVWRVQLSGDGRPRTMSPRLLSIDEPRRLLFETRILGGWAARLTHAFVVDEEGPERSVLHQRFEVTGPLVAPLWPILEAGATQFSALGDDLARELSGYR